MNTTATTPDTTATAPTITTATAHKLPLEVAYQTLANGIVTILTDVPSFVIRGATYTREELVRVFQQRVHAAEDTKTAKNDWHTAIQKEKTVQAAVKPLRDAVLAFVTGRYGRDSATLREFGFVPAKARKTTVAAKAAGVTKRTATRAARNTRGKVQKKAIKGTPSITPSPVAPTPRAAPPSAPTPTPATPGASA